MTDGIKKECKDEVPLRTVARIKSILAGLPLKLVEKNIKSTSNTFTTTLFFDGTGVGTRGKGVTRALSQASAYAEFIERLQNMVLAAPFHLSPEILSSGAFKFSPDEKTVSGEYVAALNKKFKNVYSVSEGADSGLAKWLQVYPQDSAPVFTGLPFCSLMDGGISYLPWQLLTLYRSNGMCAGNTPEEALVQGLSEILERYVNKVVINTAVAPPDVPAAYLRKFRRSRGIIKEIEKSGKYRVLVKDCSLGKGFPVLAIVLISLKDQSYMVNFGAHPRFEIALERCLTEALQSYRVSASLGKSFFPFTFSEKPVPHPSNYINSVRVGRAVYSASLFSGKPGYEFSPWKDPGYDNKKLLRGLVSFLGSLDAEVLVRDKSFLGFRAYQIVVPGLSEVEEPADIFVPSVILRNEVERSMRNLPSLTAAQCDSLLAHIMARVPYLMECRKLSGFLDFPVKESFPWDKLSVPLFAAMLYYRKGDVPRSHGVMNSVVSGLGNVPPGKKGGPDHTYLKCLRDYLSARKNSVDGDNISGVLGRFYPAPLVSRVLSEWGKPEDVLKSFSALPCGPCTPCKLSRHCRKDYFKELYLELKERIAKNPIDQERLKEFSLPLSS